MTCTRSLSQHPAPARAAPGGAAVDLEEGEDSQAAGSVAAAEARSSARFARISIPLNPVP